MSITHPDQKLQQSSCSMQTTDTSHKHITNKNSETLKITKVCLKIKNPEVATIAIIASKIINQSIFILFFWNVWISFDIPSYRIKPPWNFFFLQVLWQRQCWHLFTKRHTSLTCVMVLQQFFSVCKHFNISSHCQMCVPSAQQWLKKPSGFGNNVIAQLRSHIQF